MRVISGAQTGVDRAALDAALALGLPCGGTVPRGRKAEDGGVPALYPVRESGDPSYASRTERNVLDADATLILARGRLSGGTLLTRRLARRHGKPVGVVDLDLPRPVERVLAFLTEARPNTLNVAGPRESSFPGIGARARAVLLEAFARWRP